jgi:acyl-CoA synthetase (AMP-forming)/AMP-acid ligase II
MNECRANTDRRFNVNVTVNMADDPLEVPLAVLAPPSPPSWRRRVALVLAVLSCPVWLPLAITLLLLFTILGTPALLGWLALFRPKLLRGLPRDVRFIARLVQATRQLNARMKSTRGAFTTADYFAEVVARHGSKPALVFEDETLTYAQVDAQSDRMAAWAVDIARLEPGDAVALLCGNRPEHLFCWLGLTKRGITTTLIPTAIRGEALSRALRECGVRVVLFEAATAEQLAPLAAAAAVPATATATVAAASAAHGHGHVSPTTAPWPALRFVCVDAADTPAWAEPLRLPTTARPPEASVRATCRTTDTLVHIFTSGTTGMPKAARLTHLRFFSAIVLPYMFNLGSDDKLYCCLPMCHTAAIGTTSLL